MHSYHRNDGPPADWLEFWVRFVCGALLGAFLGIAVMQSETSAEHVWVAVLAGGVVCGLAAAWFGDRFWFSLAYLFSFW